MGAPSSRNWALRLSVALRRKPAKSDRGTIAIAARVKAPAEGKGGAVKSSTWRSISPVSG